jgi:hypothetical protein
MIKKLLLITLAAILVVFTVLGVLVLVNRTGAYKRDGELTVVYQSGFGGGAADVTQRLPLFTSANNDDPLPQSRENHTRMLRANTFTRAGHTFAGWRANWANTFTGASYVDYDAREFFPAGLKAANMPIIITARWVPNGQTVPEQRVLTLQSRLVEDGTRGPWSGRNQNIEHGQSFWFRANATPTGFDRYQGFKFERFEVTVAGTTTTHTTDITITFNSNILVVVFYSRVAPVASHTMTLQSVARNSAGTIVNGPFVNSYTYTRGHGWQFYFVTAEYQAAYASRGFTLVAWEVLVNGVRVQYHLAGSAAVTPRLDITLTSNMTVIAHYTRA